MSIEEVKQEVLVGEDADLRYALYVAFDLLKRHSVFDAERVEAILWERIYRMIKR